MTDREQVKKDLRAGLLPVREIARRAGCSVRTVYRIQAQTATGRGSAAATKPEKSLSALIEEFEQYYKTEV